MTPDLFQALLQQTETLTPEEKLRLIAHLADSLRQTQTAESSPTRPRRKWSEIRGAPVIYYVEQNPIFLPNVDGIFQAIGTGRMTAIASAITLAECLVAPYRLGLTQLQQDFTDLICHGDNTEFVQIDRAIAQTASTLRAKYNLSLTDALQVSSALQSCCQALLTNDVEFKRVTEISILLVTDLNP
jgi:predicted nucleic acid-binding protein